MEEFARSIERATMEWKRNGKILKIILFGSYARNDWVDEPDNGCQSDYDLLVVVSHEDLTGIADHWYIAEDRILRDPAIDRTVNIIVDTMQDVNQALQRGEYFWVDIIRDGIALYELPNHPLAAPQPMTTPDAYEMAKGYFQKQSASVANWLKLVAQHPAAPSSNHGIPEDRVGPIIVLSGRPAEIGVDAPRTEFGSGEAERDVNLARHVADPDPASTDFDLVGIDAKIGLDVAGFRTVRPTSIAARIEKRAKLAGKALLDRAVDETDCGHDASPFC
jgi:predicted nucleotidyltransferase